MSKLANVWVFSDIHDRYPELLAAAQTLGQTVNALIIGNEDDAAKLIKQGADRVYLLGTPSEETLIENYAEPLMAQLKQVENPSLLLMSATKRSKALAARLSVKLQAGLINDAAEICLNNGQVQAKHRVYGGLAFSEARITSGLAIVTLVAGAFDALPADENRTGSITNVSFVMPESPLVFVERKPKQGSNVDLSKARRVVGIGRGLTAEADLKMVEELAGLLDAELGCSRPIAEDEHWMERERYIGVSGVMLKSDIYLALGISGQIQHMVGANAARTIVAINKDKNAPIFQYADYGLVGDIYKAIPALITQLKG